MGFYQTNLTFSFSKFASGFYSTPYPKTRKQLFYFKLSFSKFASDFYSIPYSKTIKLFFYFKLSFSKFTSDLINTQAKIPHKFKTHT